MRRYKIVQTDTDTITSHSGLALVGRALARTQLDKDLSQISLRHGIAHADCVRAASQGVVYEAGRRRCA